MILLKTFDNLSFPIYYLHLSKDYFCLGLGLGL